MRRRRVMVLGTVLLAGCGSDGGNGNGDDGTPTADDTDTPDDDDVTTPDDGDGTDTPTPEGIENRTGQDADVGGSGQFQPTVTYNSCTTVTLEADEPYSAVAIGLVDGTNEMYQEGYEGATTFEADQTIDEVLIWSAAGDKSNKVNPSLDSCPGSD